MGTSTCPEIGRTCTTCFQSECSYMHAQTYFQGECSYIREETYFQDECSYRRAEDEKGDTDVWRRRRRSTTSVERGVLNNPPASPRTPPIGAYMLRSHVPSGRFTSSFTWGLTNIAHHVIQRTLSPRVLSQMTPYDMASDTSQPPRHPYHSEPSCIEFDRAL